MSENPPAFPRASFGEHNAVDHPGMTLRDWFAGQALVVVAPHWPDYGPDDATARRAYAIADAMLLARSNQGDQ